MGSGFNLTSAMVLYNLRRIPETSYLVNLEPYNIIDFFKRLLESSLTRAAQEGRTLPTRMVDIVREALVGSFESWVYDMCWV